MSKHKFFRKNDDGSWMVSCPITGGEFSTALWISGKVQRQTCPCCGLGVSDEIIGKNQTTLNKWGIYREY